MATESGKFFFREEHENLRHKLTDFFLLTDRVYLSQFGGLPEEYGLLSFSLCSEDSYYLNVSV